MNDVNGTRYHLMLGQADWERCSTEGGSRQWEYDPDRQVVRLQEEIYTFEQRGPQATPVTPDDRRGAARDAYGNWYWIDRDERRILTRGSQASQAEELFPGRSDGGDPPEDLGGFRPSEPIVPEDPERLAGLAVSNDGYLVVGSPTTGSLLVFDLYSFDGGFLRIPLQQPQTTSSESAQPFDLAALADGGLLVLDRGRKQVWRLDSALRPMPVRARAAGDLLLFQPAQGRERRHRFSLPFDLIDLSATTDPIAIEPLSDGSFWVLDNPAREGASVLWRFSLEDAFAPQSFELVTRDLVDEGADDLDLSLIRGHDLAYVPARQDQEYDPQKGTLYIADVSGNQAYALRVDLAEDRPLRIMRQYFPLRDFTGSALVSVWPEEKAYYHQKQRQRELQQERQKEHWLPINALPRMKYEEQATLLLPPLDGRDPGCIWHRLCADACLPPETNLIVETRAADVAANLRWQEWQTQPSLYRRSSGSEIPYSNLWSSDDQSRPYTGTWELLFQQALGRYLELRLTLVGNGRSTPMIRALRAHYPRFS
ncbi:MAG: hypothetical protein ACE5Q6_22430, partial [Dehalococcoidia bacterium]